MISYTYKAISFFFVRYITAVNIQTQLNAIKSHSVFKGDPIPALRNIEIICICSY